MAKDIWGPAYKSLGDPAESVRKITPNDLNEIPSIPKAIYVGTGGDINILAVGDVDPVIWKNVPSASLLPIRPVRILTSGTTAADILALY